MMYDSPTCPLDADSDRKGVVYIASHAHARLLKSLNMCIELDLVRIFYFGPSKSSEWGLTAFLGPRTGESRLLNPSGLPYRNLHLQTRLHSIAKNWIRRQILQWPSYQVKVRNKHLLGIDFLDKQCYPLWITEDCMNRSAPRCKMPHM